MVNKHLPDMQQYISSVVSPMVASAKAIKKEDPEAVVVFVGPCFAKKEEAKEHSAYVDYVLTFEELAALVVGGGINISESKETNFNSEATTDANLFARSDGVLRSVENTLALLAPGLVVRAEHCDGLASYRSCLQEIRDGKRSLNFVEGMACLSGCVGGPGTLTDSRVTTRLVETFANSSAKKAAPENSKAAKITGLGLQNH